MEFEAYFEEWSRLPGETVKMAVSTDHAVVQASLERLVRGPSGGPDDITHAFGVPIEGLDASFPGRRQPTAVGSYGELPLPAAFGADGFTLHTTFWPTLVAKDELQVIVSVGSEHSNVGVGILRGELVLVTAGSVKALGVNIDDRVWHSLVLTLVAGEAVVDLRRTSGLPAGAVDFRESEAVEQPATLERIRLATDAVDTIGAPTHPFNGKIGSIALFKGVVNASDLHGANAEPGALEWDFGMDFATDVLAERQGRAPDGRLVNGGDRGVTGHNWSGVSDSFVTTPEQYAAVHFHDDDMVDAGWEYDLEFVLPEDLESGVYAVKLSSGESEDRYPLFVRGTGPADVLLVMPTNTYLAYGNDRFASGDMSEVMGHETVISPDEQYLNSRREFGMSCYDVHSDGSPVRYSSRRRPLVNVRPQYPNFLTGTYRHFAVDLYFVEWLSRENVSFHVVTDEDVHLQSDSLLSNYRVVVTGSHPEYWTSQALDALQAHLRSAGRLMYMGGNGFYWVTTHAVDKPWRIEVRRDNGGLRSWDPPPGERTHVATGEPGGLWRYRGRGPNTVAGVAFATEGWSAGRGYERISASYEGPGAAFFEGIDDEVIGDFGFILGGAAADECDRFDLALGSPPQTMVLASATGFGDEYQIVNEDVLIPKPDQGGTKRPDRVRADMVYIPIAGGGAVFSASSIAFAGALAWNGYDNNVARLCGNVLRRFAGDDLP